MTTKRRVTKGLKNKQIERSLVPLIKQELVECKESGLTVRPGSSLQASNSSSSASSSPSKTVSTLSLSPVSVPVCNVTSRKRGYTVIATGNSSGDGDSNCLTVQRQRYPFSQAQLMALPPREKIPRPPNAFMLFANEWRKKLAIQFPRESNKDISVRLGTMWKNMQKNDKERYFTLARQVDAEHKRKYPNYVYNPKEARMRKALREQSRENRSQVGRTTPGMSLLPTNNGRAPPQPSPQQWFKSPQNFNSTTNILPRTNRHPGLMSPKMMDQQRSMEEMRKSIREQVEQGLMHGYSEMMDMDGLPYHQVPMPGAGDYNSMAEMEGQAWYPFGQGAPHGGSAYAMRHGDEKMHAGAPWNIHFSQENRAHQASPYMMRHQMMGGASSYGNNMPQPMLPPTAMNQTPRATATPQQQQQQPQPQQQQQQPQPPYGGIYPPQPAAGGQLTPSLNDKRGQNREERIRMLDVMPTASSNQTPPTTTTAAAATAQKTPVSSNNYMSTPTSQSTTKTSESSGTKTEKSDPAAPTTADTDSTADNSNSADSNRPLPAFEQAFGSTEIGRYSHEGFFNSTQQTPSNQGTQMSDPKCVPAQSSKSSEPVPHPSLMNPMCEDFQLEMPTFDLSPIDTLECNDPLMSSPSWPSMFYYSPVSTNGDYYLAPGAENACFNSSHLPPMAFPSYFDYSLLPSADFLTDASENDAHLELSGGPSSSFGNGNNLHVAFDGGGSTILAPGNTFRDTHDGLEYVTLHIPASTLVTNNSVMPSSFQNDCRFMYHKSDTPHNESINKESEAGHQMRLEKSIKENPFPMKSKTPDSIRKMDSTSSKEESNGQRQQLGVKKEPKSEKDDDLQRQELTITGMAVREPIVISQNERICVLMNTPTPMTNGKEFTSL